VRINSHLRWWINFAAMQAGWFACVLLAAHGGVRLAPFAALLVLLLHIALSRHRIGELRVAAATLAVGCVWESIVISTGWLKFVDDGAIIPWWIFAMWPMFSTTLNISMGFLQGRPWLAALLGVVGAPLSYAAGARLGAVMLPNRTAALTLVGVGWMLILPLLIAMARRLSSEWQR
jgi:hypothetical protein